MAIDPRLVGRLKGGKVEFLCECGGLPQYATSENLLMVCSNGHPLGEWNTAEERIAELNALAETFRRHRAPAPRRARAYRSKEESKSKNMPRGGGHKKNPGRKRGHK